MDRSFSGFWIFYLPLLFDPLDLTLLQPVFTEETGANFFKRTTLSSRWNMIVPRVCSQPRLFRFLSLFESPNFGGCCLTNYGCIFEGYKYSFSVGKRGLWKVPIVLSLYLLYCIYDATQSCAWGYAGFALDFTSRVLLLLAFSSFPPPLLNRKLQTRKLLGRSITRGARFWAPSSTIFHAIILWNV